MRYYIVPRIGDGSAGNEFRPKYTDADALGAGWNVNPWTARDHDLASVFVVALNLTTANHNTLAAQADVIVIPANLLSTVGSANVATVRAKMESVAFPGSWIVAATTYREILAMIHRQIHLWQRFRGLADNLSLVNLQDKNGAAITLDTTVGSLTAGQKTFLLNAASSFGLDTSAATNATTLRVAVKAIADQLGSIGFAGDTF